MAGVDPFGTIYPTLLKNGTLMGNRGNLRKSGESDIVRLWSGRRWIYCTCQGERKDVSYTKLFFVDEATALAAGHRPCGSCLAQRYKEFRAAWVAGNPEYGFGLGTDIKLIDQVLDEERKDEEGAKKTFHASFGELPEGVVVSSEDRLGAFLYQGGALHRWTAGGYAEESKANPGARVKVLTPASVVNAIRWGFAPTWRTILCPSFKSLIG